MNDEFESLVDIIRVFCRRGTLRRSIHRDWRNWLFDLLFRAMRDIGNVDLLRVVGGRFD